MGHPIYILIGDTKSARNKNAREANATSYCMPRKYET